MNSMRRLKFFFLLNKLSMGPFLDWICVHCTIYSENYLSNNIICLNHVITPSNDRVKVFFKRDILSRKKKTFLIGGEVGKIPRVLLSIQMIILKKKQYLCRDQPTLNLYNNDNEGTFVNLLDFSFNNQNLITKLKQLDIFLALFFFLRNDYSRT